MHTEGQTNNFNVCSAGIQKFLETKHALI